MNDSPLALSLFPGIGLLDMAFELEGFTVVTDVLDTIDRQVEEDAK